MSSLVLPTEEKMEGTIPYFDLTKSMFLKYYNIKQLNNYVSTKLNENRLVHNNVILTLGISRGSKKVLIILLGRKYSVHKRVKTVSSQHYLNK